MNTAVLFLAHQWNHAIGRRFARLHAETQGEADCFLLLQDDGGPIRESWESFLRKEGLAEAMQTFVAAHLPGELGYPFFGKRQILGNTHFPLVRFARTARYRHYWQVESDVEYRGHWQGFMRAFRESDAPLLASHLHRFADWPTWPWWQPFAAPASMDVPQDRWRKAFFPVSRFSLPAIEAIEAAHRAGWSGHFEALVPTVLSLAGLEACDLREHLPCYIGESQNPSAILPLQSTLRWRPRVRLDEFKSRGMGALLFHPVKGDWWFDGNRALRLKTPAASAA